MSIIAAVRRFAGFSDETFRFLRALARNNRRDWFLDRKHLYEERVRAPMEALVGDLGDRLRIIAPEFIAHPKTSIYRIYRDTRFTADKSPYKSHIAAVFPSRDTGKHRGAGFYVHVSAGEIFAGGGLYRPEARDLQAVRSKLSTDHRRFRRLIRAPRFRRMFGELQGEQLRKVPRGFSPDHPAADLLRYTQFLAGRTLSPETAKSPEFLDATLDTFRALLPICRFLNDAILESRRSLEEGRGGGPAEM